MFVNSVGVFLPGMDRLCPLVGVAIISVSVVYPGKVRLGLLVGDLR